MLNKRTQLELVLRRAMRRANLVTGYVHKCRRKGCGYQEPTADANPRRCPKCKFKLSAIGQVRPIRFHHLRHTTASLLLMSGADLAAVQRIMRHHGRTQSQSSPGRRGLGRPSRFCVNQETGLSLPPQMCVARTPATI